MKKNAVTNIIIIIVLMQTAAILSHAINTAIPSQTLSYITLISRSLIYTGILIFWIASLHKRIISPVSRRLLESIAVMMIFWIFMHTVNFFLTIPSSPVIRYLWYSYYVPVIMIPSLFNITALTIDMTSDFKFPRQSLLLIVPGIILLALIFSNNIHQKFLKFMSEPFSKTYFSYGIVYWLIFAWVLFSGTVSITIMIIKHRNPSKRKRALFPFAIILCAAIYSIIHITHLEWLQLLYIDDSVPSLCFLFAFTIESCIQTNLIISNSRYEELFKVSTISAQIVDDFYRPYISSTHVVAVQPKVLRRTEISPLVVNNGVRLSGAKISGGHVLWQEDISELIEVLANLHDMEESLQGENRILQQNYETRKRIQKLEEQNRLYDEIHKQTADKIDKLAQMISKFRCQTNENDKHRTLSRMLTLGAYLKRRSNLIFIGLENGRISEHDMELCFDEMTENLQFVGISSGCFIRSGEIHAWAAADIFDFYEYVIETAFDCLESVMIRIYRKNTDLILNIESVSKDNLCNLIDRKYTITRIDDELSTENTDTTHMYQILLPVKGGVV